jgi:hypothetical protein
MGHAVDIADGDEFHEEAYVCVDDYGVEGASACGVGFGQLAVVVDGGANAQAANQAQASSRGGFVAGREIFYFGHWVP